MKFWRIISVVGGLLVAIGYTKGVQQIYNYWESKAIQEAAKTKAFRTECPTHNPFDCTFTEIPVHVNRLVDIYLPTGGCAVIFLAAIIAACIWLYRSGRQASG
ncbi:MAG: hypothetical protein HZB75_01400 [Candidatus Saccharibacteria bacterium]|nr:MAG: hypothetical protein HZB75_01400 [Candidatus Saccharibacteria bacterium]